MSHIAIQHDKICLRLTMYNKKIVHGVDSQGVTLSIPMPGHDMIHTAEYQTLKELIQECDVVYLLKDTRV